MLVDLRDRWKDRIKSNVDRQAMRYHLNLRPDQSRIAKVPVVIETSRFTVKIAETYGEIHQVLKLRYQVFIQEQLGRSSRVELDVDHYDRVADHLIIVDRQSNQVVGTYRLMSSAHVDKFYSESEFHLNGLKSLPGVKIELGRACIHKDFRKGLVMTLLWRGLSDYMQLAGASYLFGCSSVKGQDSLWAAMILKRLQELGHWDDTRDVSPRADFISESLRENLEVLQKSGATFHARFDQEMLPALLKGYLRAGAKVCGLPALDRSFECFDFFTLLKVESIAESYKDKFNIVS